MKKIILAVVVLLCFGKNVMAQENNKAQYMAMYRYNNIHCTFYVNNIPLHSSIDYHPPHYMSFPGRIGALLAEGENTFGILSMNIPLDPKDAYCEMIIHASVYNQEKGKMESKEVSSIKVTIDDQGNFITSESKDYPAPSLTGPITMQELDEPTFNDGIVNDVMVTRPLEVNHWHKNFSWTYRSTPFIDTPENREKLWAKYEEIRAALAAKDEKRYLALMQPGLNELEAYTGNPSTNAYTQSEMSFVHEAWEADNFKVLPIDRDDYKLIIGADGRLFRLVHEYSLSKMSSPIVFKKNDSQKAFNYTFTLIDGKIVNAY